MKLSHVFRVFVVLALFVAQVVQAEQITPVKSEVAADNALLLNELISARSTSDKKNLINLIANSNFPQRAKVLSALQDGDLYYTKADEQLVYAFSHPDGYQITSVIDGENLGVIGSRKVRKISINNELRTVLRGVLAELSLRSEDVFVRLSAAKDLIRSPSPEFLYAIERAKAVEVNEKVLASLNIATAMINLNSEEQVLRLDAIEAFRGTLDSDAMSILAAMQLKDSEGNYLEQDDLVRESAAAVLSEMRGEAEMYKLVENVFFGLSLGSVLLLTAVGLAITFGVMGVINMAHGEMMMLGAYTTYVIQLLMPNYIDYSIVVAIPAAFLVSGLVGIVIERGVIRHLYGRPLETLLATFGVSLILQQAVRSIFSPLNKSVSAPSWLSGSWEINGALSLTYNRLYIIIFSLVVLLMLVFLLKKTFVGLQMRAVTQNRAMANSMGIRTGWVDALTFGLGSGIAGIAGVALSQLTNVGPNLGQSYIIDSFMVVVFGGVGNLFGTFFAAMSLGVANKFLEPFAGAVLAKIFVLVFIILFIQWRPRGLFALKGRSVED
ncbi:urea ABC transporter permease subunit UrtB [Zhongshania aquimaris]|uniref:Urea ABC transporter permease subunit UrtB n=1 Tax=Zhongshania aquimaris TaxID=2857107 RepID=A0ABS6VRG0_9GAMM|nr:urea ABC transporter permease subunit UrtB [Zhongshania aquimaris]MBW2940908.1 urea ABC transporter permease subunit UrtB [Zhongshania aquimaris]